MDLELACVWVDLPRVYPKSVIKSKARRHGTCWAHMWCNPGHEDLLHEAAREIGLKRKYFQDKPGFPHYDLTTGKRKLALKLEVAKPRSLADWISERRTRDELSNPEKEWSPSKVEKPSRIMYVIGEETGEGEYGMWHGPSPDLRDMLNTEGESSNSVIIEFPKPDVSNVLYRWSEKEEKWIYAKQ